MKSTRSIVTALALAVSLAAPALTLASSGSGSSGSGNSGSGNSGSSQVGSSTRKAAKKAKAARPLRLSGSVGNDNVGVKAKAKYEEKTKNGVTTAKFSVEVENATPGDTYAVTVKGIAVGTVTIGALGEGEIEFQSNPRDADDLPLPAGFPALKAGDTVQIGALTVTLRAR